ncbi:MAG: hypothetical protein ABR555_01900 [Pyrinomonadaceae bacterium]
MKTIWGFWPSVSANGAPSIAILARARVEIAAREAAGWRLGI